MAVFPVIDRRGLLGADPDHLHKVDRIPVTHAPAGGIGLGHPVVLVPLGVLAARVHVLGVIDLIAGRNLAQCVGEAQRVLESALRAHGDAPVFPSLGDRPVHRQSVDRKAGLVHDGDAEVGVAVDAEDAGLRAVVRTVPVVDLVFLLGRGRDLKPLRGEQRDAVIQVADAIGVVAVLAGQVEAVGIVMAAVTAGHEAHRNRSVRMPLDPGEIGIGAGRVRELRRIREQDRHTGAAVGGERRVAVGLGRHAAAADKAGVIHLLWVGDAGEVQLVETGVGIFRQDLRRRRDFADDRLRR